MFLGEQVQLRALVEEAEAGKYLFPLDGSVPVELQIIEENTSSILNKFYHLEAFLREKEEVCKFQIHDHGHFLSQEKNQSLREGVDGLETAKSQFFPLPLRTGFVTVSPRSSNLLTVSKQARDFHDASINGSGVLISSGTFPHTRLSGKCRVYLRSVSFHEHED